MPSGRRTPPESPTVGTIPAERSSAIRRRGREASATGASATAGERSWRAAGSAAPAGRPRTRRPRPPAMPQTIPSSSADEAANDDDHPDQQRQRAGDEQPQREQAALDQQHAELEEEQRDQHRPGPEQAELDRVVAAVPEEGRDHPGQAAEKTDDLSGARQAGGNLCSLRVRPPMVRHDRPVCRRRPRGTISPWFQHPAADGSPSSPAPAAASAPPRPDGSRPRASSCTAPPAVPTGSRRSPTRSAASRRRATSPTARRSPRSPSASGRCCTCWSTTPAAPSAPTPSKGPTPTTGPGRTTSTCSAPCTSPRRCCPRCAPAATASSSTWARPPAGWSTRAAATTRRPSTPSRR